MSTVTYKKYIQDHNLIQEESNYKYKYIAFNKNRFDYSITQYNTNKSYTWAYRKAAQIIFDGKKYKLRPVVVKPENELYEIRKVYSLNITENFAKFILDTQGMFDLSNINLDISSILGKNVFAIEPKTPENNGIRVYNSEKTKYINGLDKIYFVVIDELVPTTPETTGKRAETINKKRNNKAADKQMFNSFFVPNMKKVLEEYGLYYDQKNGKTYVNQYAFSKLIRDMLEKNVLPRLIELGIDAKINPNAYYDGHAYPIIIKGINKQMLGKLANEQNKGEQNAI